MGRAAGIAQQQANQLQVKSIVLGYNVVPTVGVEGGNPKNEVEITFRLWRFDEKQRIDADDVPSYSSVAEVEAQLQRLAELPRWCLDLVGNSTARVVTETEGVFTVITDTRTGQDFYLRTVDMEAITVLPIHAEAPPAIGNWRPCRPGE
ncbi:hypothetical protein BST37_05595 [Mycobacterium noviomagense]|nr:hypothetical protein BST37_05595 [Mycobacterium noviomagense]